MGNTIRWLTIQDAAERACCESGQVRRAVRRGDLRAVRMRKSELRFLESWIDEWLKDQLVSDAGEIDVAIDVVPSAARELSSSW
jgi:excisionase family DNA binding protein